MTESPLEPSAAPAATSRRGFLMLGALAGAAAFALPRLPARALDLGLASQLKFLQNAAYLQNQFFLRALTSRALDELPTANLAPLHLIAREDGEQARWFAMARAGRGLMPNRFTQPSSLTQPNFFINAGTYGDRDKFFDSAIAIKSAVVGAYHGLVGEGGEPEMVQALAALAGVQNRHLAMLEEMAGRDPFVTYVEAKTLQEAGKTLSKYGFGTEVGI